MAKNDPTLPESISVALDWARAKLEPYLTWLPDWLEPYVVDIGAVLALFAALIALWQSSTKIWGAVIWAPRGLWRWVTGYEPQKSPVEIAAEAAKKAEEAALRTEEALRTLLSEQAEKAEDTGMDLPEDAIDRAVAAAREVLLSNDPSKAEAQDALREGNIRAAEDALEGAFNREQAAAIRIGDEAQQLKSKAAQTAREKAALAATRSVADALSWYQKAAELKPEDFWTQIELARLHQASGSLLAAARAAQAALKAANEDRDRSVALDEIGDVIRSQGDLGKALESYQASMVIRERLAKDDASNAGLQRDLSVSHERIGDLQEVRGNPPAAIEAYEESLVIAQSLADRFPDHPQFRSDLEITKRRLDELRRILE